MIFTPFFPTTESQLVCENADAGAYFKDNAVCIIAAVVGYFLYHASVGEEILTVFLFKTHLEGTQYIFYGF